EGNVEIDPEIAGNGLQLIAYELAIALRPWRDGTVEQRLRFVRHDPPRIEVDHRAKALAVDARAVGRVERERPRGHLGHAQAAVDARQAAREQPVARFVRVDHDDVVGQRERVLDRLHQPALDPAADDQAVDDDLDRVVAPAIELDVLLERSELSVDARLGIAALPQRGELLLELALAPADDRREDVDALVLWLEPHHVPDP